METLYYIKMVALHKNITDAAFVLSNFTIP